ncbi:MAG: class I SAM-dependent methyltransferase [Actinomycetota bacterium]|nr:class I SAM-dependent methyltransferase [Actinomycetota bacterium]
MNVLVAIAYYGTTNEEHLLELVRSYDAMTDLDVDIVVLTEAPKALPPHVRQVIGLPTPDPYSLPFAHKTLFARHRDDYDLFIYSEDDTLITRTNIDAFLWATGVLGEDRIAGFLRKEQHPGGTVRCSSVHNHYHWRPDSAFRAGGQTFARFTNDHGACFLLTKAQLDRAIRSGGFLRPARSGRYSMRVTAATDPYTGCGMERVVCISRLDDFLLPHLTNRYLDTLGRPIDDVRRQTAALEATLDGSVPTARLIDPTGPDDDARWDKRFYERIDADVVGVLGALGPRRVLSLGAGSGELEAALGHAGHDVVAIPLDAIVGATAAAAGVSVTSPVLDEALAGLDEPFDALVAANVLHHFDDPVATLERLRTVLRPGAQVVVTTPNLRRDRVRAVLGKAPAPPRATGGAGRPHLVGRSGVVRWLRAAGIGELTCVPSGGSARGRRAATAAVRAPRLLTVGAVPSGSGATPTAGRGGSHRHNARRSRRPSTMPAAR